MRFGTQDMILTLTSIHVQSLNVPLQLINAILLGINNGLQFINPPLQLYDQPKELVLLQHLNIDLFTLMIVLLYQAVVLIRFLILPREDL